MLHVWKSVLLCVISRFSESEAPWFWLSPSACFSDCFAHCRLRWELVESGSHGICHSLSPGLLGNASDWVFISFMAWQTLHRKIQFNTYIATCLKKKDTLFWQEISQNQESCIFIEFVSVAVVSYIFWFDHWPSRAGQWKEMPLLVALYATAI